MYCFIFNQLGNVHRLSGDLEKSYEYLTKAIAVKLKIYQKDNIYMYQSFQNIGTYFRETGNCRKALSIFQIWRRSFKKNADSTNIEFGHLYNNLSNAYSECNILDSALIYAEKSKTVFLANVGMDNYLTGSSMLTLGNALVKSGKINEASFNMKKQT
ncbi:MAG: tetratricopeptide repeat protein [Saprospiraceae bacterium]